MCTAVPLQGKTSGKWQKIAFFQRFFGRKPILFLVFMLPVCVGCTSFRDYIANGFKVGPNYCPPAAQVSDQWLDEGNPNINGGELQNVAWWQSFNDSVLNSLISTAYSQNLSLRAAGMRILEARAQRGMVVGNLFPQQQDAFGEYGRIALSKNGPSGKSPNLHFEEWTLGARLSWELDFWGRFRRAIEAADAQLDASIENYDHVLVLLLAEVAQNYADVRIAEQRLAYAKQNVEIQRGSLEIAKHRLEQGIVTRLDVTQAISNLEQTASSIGPLEAARRRAVNRLGILMGMPPQNLDAILANNHGIPKVSSNLAVGIPAELLRRRPDVRKAEREVATQCALIGVATSDLYPHFSLNGTIYVDALKAENLFNGNSVAGAIGPSFRWDILNYGRLVNNIRVQKARFQQLVAEYQNTVLKANAEAEDAIITLLKAKEQADFLRKSAEASSESVKLVSAQYDQGVVDFNRVFVVQRELTYQQDQLAIAEGMVVQAMIQLYKSLGGGWQIRLNGSGWQPAPHITALPPVQKAPEPPADIPQPPTQPAADRS